MAVEKIMAMEDIANAQPLDANGKLIWGEAALTLVETAFQEVVTRANMAVAARPAPVVIQPSATSVPVFPAQPLPPRPARISKTPANPDNYAL